MTTPARVTSFRANSVLENASLARVSPLRMGVLPEIFIATGPGDKVNEHTLENRGVRRLVIRGGSVQDRRRWRGCLGLVESDCEMETSDESGGIHRGHVHDAGRHAPDWARERDIRALRRGSSEFRSLRRGVAERFRASAEGRAALGRSLSPAKRRFSASLTFGSACTPARPKKKPPTPPR